MLILIIIENTAIANTPSMGALKNTLGHSIESQIKKPVGIKNINKKIIERIIPPPLAHLFLLIVAKDNRKDKNAHINKRIESNENQMKKTIDKAISYSIALCEIEGRTNDDIEYTPPVAKIIPIINHKKINILIIFDFLSILYPPLKNIK